MVSQNSIDAGTKNLIPLTMRPAEEQREIRSRGGKKRVEQKKELKHAKEILEQLLAEDLTKDRVIQILGNDSRDRNTYSVLLQKMIQVANDGNVKAFELLRDTVGDKPSEQVKIDADIITANDRRLLEMLGSQLSQDNDTDTV